MVKKIVISSSNKKAREFFGDLARRKAEYRAELEKRIRDRETAIKSHRQSAS